MKVSALWYLFAVFVGVVALLPGMQPPVADADCKTTRVRKNYDSMNVTERQLYRNALQLAMDKGYYIKFVEMHMEKMSEMVAHRVCMFTYWHRYFLLGFENMLRSLGPAYECITVPFWDQMQQNARAMTGSCTSLQSCAMIVRDMGGSTIGPIKDLNINGAWVTGDRCVGAAPLNHFCETSSKTGSACARCVPRNNLLNTQFPPATNFASIYRQLFTSGDFVSTGKSIEEGMHNSLHAQLGGAMGTYQSPSDPLFWSHHAYVDLLLTIYLRCRVGLGKLTDEQKMNNPYAFVQCPHREDAGFFTPQSTVTMRDGELGIDPTQVSLPGQDLYPFFAGLPNKYYQLSDITQLGDNRYTYQVGGLVGQLALQCDAAGGTRRRLRQLANQSGTGHADCKSDLAEDAPVPNHSDPTPRADHKGNSSPFSHDEDKSVGPDYTPTVDSTTDSAPATAPPLPADLPVDHSDDHDPEAAKVARWVDDVRHQLVVAFAQDSYQQKPLDHIKVADQLEKMVCLFYDQCRGGVKDYSNEFKKAFNVKEPPPCKQLVDDLKANSTDPVRLPEWKKLMEKYFPCDAPTMVPYTNPNDLPAVETPAETPTPTPTVTPTPTPTVTGTPTPTPLVSTAVPPTPASPETSAPIQESQTTARSESPAPTPTTPPCPTPTQILETPAPTPTPSSSQESQQQSQTTQRSST